MSSNKDKKVQIADQDNMEDEEMNSNVNPTKKKSLEENKEMQGNIQPGNKKNDSSHNSQSASTRSYLEHTVVPIVTQGMMELAKARPDNPLEFLGNYLLKHANNSK